jgi:hypothetical protein
VYKRQPQSNYQPYTVYFKKILVIYNNKSGISKKSKQFTSVKV